MRFQIALDMHELDKDLALLEKIRPYVDIAEIGSCLVMNEGMRAVRKVKELYPDLTVLADVKAIDGGEYLAHVAYEAGADIVTTVGVTTLETIEGVVRAAKRFGKESFVDLIGVEDVVKRAKEVDDIGVDYVCVHTPSDQQSKKPIAIQELIAVQRVVKHAKIVMTGGVKLNRLPEIVPYRPDVIIVGSGVYMAEDPVEEARKISEIIHAQ